MLHDPADDDGLPVGDGIHVHLDGVLQELLYQQGVILGSVHGASDVLGQLALIVADLHGPSPQDVRRPHQDGVADAGGNLFGPLG